uniref:Uroporphyrinogen decarboxylase n=1 Tax=Candidatus Kentrum eta TaxID=2126337 RepID=A0A450UEN0_9GAMM|nr:MAG: uroporphyrinogen decarboxylase [Candidatus Kentron sp. H]VFJ91025.1 MAG: uroporphyrinogen decarboxylase [Candidatus Kentron sp. H]VFJ97334.1 MAG: uroporphyrinogen decarboxylase [Candidatus Kentron sp. H]
MSDTPENDRLLRALARQPVDVTPVWLMRQAGRYLPEYRQLRARAGSFLGLCTDPELACEVTLQPLRRFPLDAAIVFSDILTIPGAMGLGLTFAEGEGPHFQRPVRNARDVDRLGIPDPEGELRYVTDALRRVRRELDNRVPLIGFAGSPWTLASYMVEGGGSTDFRHIKGMMFREPALIHRLLALLANAVIDYLRAQVDAGAQALMLFDTWGGVLSTPDYRRFSLEYLSRIVAGIRETRVPLILFTKGGGAWIEAMADTGCDAIGLDWTTEMGKARGRVGDRVALQGNADPCILYAPPERIRQEVGAILEGFGHGSGHIFNLGHGVHPHVDPEKVGVLIDAVHELSAPYHSHSS